MYFCLFTFQIALWDFDLCCNCQLPWTETDVLSRTSKTNFATKTNELFFVILGQSTLSFLIWSCLTSPFFVAVGLLIYGTIVCIFIWSRRFWLLGKKNKKNPRLLCVNKLAVTVQKLHLQLHFVCERSFWNVIEVNVSVFLTIVSCKR